MLTNKAKDNIVFYNAVNVDRRILNIEFRQQELKSFILTTDLNNWISGLI